MVHVISRKGKKTKFNKSKLKKSVLDAATEANVGEHKSKKIATEIANSIEEKIKTHDKIDASKIREYVVGELFTREHHKVAHAYRGYKKEYLPPSVKGAVEKVIDTAEKIEEERSEILFLTKLQRFGVALGGAVLLQGVLFVLIGLFLFFKNVQLGFLAGGAFYPAIILLVLTGAIQFLAGLVMISR